MKLIGDEKMGMIKKALVYTGFLALGFGICYKSCVNENYSVIERDGRVYVEDKRTGKQGEVDDFGKGSGSSRGLGDRIKDAYKSLTK